jgi:quinol-cytochrome oxidoreductase complex cytochrome b subunit/mono/diheme cytochrome c family protein
VISRLCDWLDHRTGYRKFMAAMLLENIPGGAKWRYVWGSALATVFAVQLVTGLLLMTGYSASETDAWSSVHYIQYEMDFGWLIRGLHHFGSQTMVVLLALHMLQVVIAGAHLPPREINWWLGLALMAVVLGLGLTGYLLPWDQKGYYATRVATNIMGDLPVLGPWIQETVVGGKEYGNRTLTRFYAVHVGVLPALLVILLIAHVAVFRRHGLTHPRDREYREQGVSHHEYRPGDGNFWPDQAFRDMVVSLAVVGVMLALVLHGHGIPLDPPADGDEQGLYDSVAHAGKQGLGANLDAPANREQEYPARPEWYFLSLFQLLKEFEGEYKLLGTVVIPNGAGVLLFLLPLFGIGRMRPFGHVVGVIVVVALLSATGWMTYKAMAGDTEDPVTRAFLNRIGQWLVPAIGGVLLVMLAGLSITHPEAKARPIIWAGGVGLLAVLGLLTAWLTYEGLQGDVPGAVAGLVESTMTDEEKRTDKDARVHQAAVKFNEDRRQATVYAARAVNIARKGVPAEGSVTLLRNDPETQFKGLFVAKCANCHSYGEFSRAAFKTTDLEQFKKAKFVASDLAGFGTEEWVYEFLLNPGGDRFYGRSKEEDGRPVFTEMAGEMETLKKRYARQPEAFKADLRKIAAWLATGPEKPPKANSPHAEAYQLMREKKEGGKYGCARCHSVAGGKGNGTTPTLTGYASDEWLRRMIRAPGSRHMYGGSNKMPAFRDLESPGGVLEMEEYRDSVAADSKVTFTQLSNVEREVLIRYLSRDDRVVFGGQPIGPPKKR